MNSTDKAFEAYRLRTRYDYPLIRKLYSALAEERAKQRIGREAFSTYMAETIRRIPPERKILFPDGSEYQIPDEPPSAETIRNFLETLREASVSDAHTRALKTSSKTLCYIHAFLWQLNPQRAASWEREENLAEANLPIANLDSGFSIIEPRVLFPCPMKLLQPTDATFAQTSYDVLNSDAPEEYDFGKTDWTVAGVFQFAESDSPMKSRFSFLSGKSWASLISGESGATADPLVTGNATAIKSKDFRFSTDDMPAIEDDAYLISVEVEPRRATQPRYVGIKIEAASITLNFLEDRSLMDLMAAINCLAFYGLGVDPRAIVPIPLSRRERALFSAAIAKA